MITLPAGVKPYNRKDAFTLVKTMLDGIPASQDQLQRLYLYFAPPVKAGSAKTAWQWVAGFVAEKDSRECLNFVYSDGSRLMATNGHILAWAPTDMPKGYYHPVTGDAVTGRDEWIYPNIDRVIPDMDGADILLSDEAFPVEIPEGDSKLQLRKIGPAYFDSRLLGVIMRANEARITRMPEDANAVMRGRTEFGEFVIMPRRM